MLCNASILIYFLHTVWLNDVEVARDIYKFYYGTIRFTFIFQEETKMKKVKEFIEEHKMKIAGVIACGVSYGIGVYVGYRHCMRDITVLGDGIIQF